MKNLFLAAGIMLCLFVIYLSIGVNPDLYVFTFMEYKFGFNLSAYWFIKVMIAACWGIYIYLSIKEEK